MTKKLIALILCLTMALLAAGCGSRIRDYEAPAPDPDAAVDATAEPTDAPADADADTAEPTAKPGLDYAAYDPDTTVATYNGKPITWREYYYWLNYFVSYIRYMTAMGAPFSGWDGTDLAEDMTNQDLVVASARESLFPHYALQELADALQISLEDADLQQIRDIFDQDADSYGDGDGTCTQEESDAFEAYLDSVFVSREFYDSISGLELLSEKVFNSLYGEGGEDLSDEDVLAFAESQSVMACKHILLLTVDNATGEALADDVIAEKKSQADALYAQLAAVADDRDALTALFDQLMQENSEDTGLQNFPDGYIFGPGEMVPVFEETTMSLDEYGLSEPVESSYGYHIILRLPVDPDGVYTATSTSLRAAAASAAFTQRLSDMQTDAEIVWEPAFDPLDFTAVFGE